MRKTMSVRDSFESIIGSRKSLFAFEDVFFVAESTLDDLK